MEYKIYIIYVYNTYEHIPCLKNIINHRTISFYSKITIHAYAYMYVYAI